MFHVSVHCFHQCPEQLAAQKKTGFKTGHVLESSQDRRMFARDTPFWPFWPGRVRFFDAISGSASKQVMQKNPGTYMNHCKRLCRLSLWLSNPVIELYKENVWSSQCQEIRVENPIKNDLITGCHNLWRHRVHPPQLPSPRVSKNWLSMIFRQKSKRWWGSIFFLPRINRAVPGICWKDWQRQFWVRTPGYLPVVRMVRLWFVFLSSKSDIRIRLWFFHVFKQVWCDDINISDGCHCFHGEIPVLHSNPKFSWSNHTFCTFCCLCRAVVHATSVSTAAMAVGWPEKWWTDRDFTMKT